MHTPKPPRSTTPNERHFSRREWLAALAAGPLPATAANAAARLGKPMRGAFMILATPYTSDKAIDYEDLAAEVKFLDRCGVQGMVWPQHASDLNILTHEERMRGMEVLAAAAKGTKPALVLGVQAENTSKMIEYARRAEELAPDALMAIPPTAAKSLDGYREYYSALCRLTGRPVFCQTAGGAPDVEPTVEFLVEMGRKFENFGYLKEEYKDAITRMKELRKYRPGPIKSILGAQRAVGWTYEMRLGMDGTLTGGPMYADVYAHIWESHLAGHHDEVRDVFAKLLVMTNLEDQIPGLKYYMMKRRGVFKTTVSRRGDYTFPPQAVAQIEHDFAALKPYLRT